MKHMKKQLNQTFFSTFRGFFKRVSFELTESKYW